MKRSEVNLLMTDAKTLLVEMKFNLPPFAFWSPGDWLTKDSSCREIIDNMLGWDITDFSSGDFRREGLLLFTLRNGNPLISRYKKTYAEKIMIIRENQETPFHFHRRKMEDIINRGGGNLLIEVWQADDAGKRTEESLEVQMDGVHRRVPGGTVLRLEPGESITLLPYQYHRFWAETECGTVLAGEVSQVNDDRNDNRFLKPLDRFAAIEEDEPPLHLLVSDYEQFLV